MTHTPSKTNTTSTCRPDCVTEVRMGNTVLTVSGYFKRDAASATPVSDPLIALPR